MATDIYSAEFQDAEIGGDKFWKLVQTMPDFNEAIGLLGLAKTHFIKLRARPDKKGEIEKIDVTLHQINVESKRINMARNEMETRQAIIELFGYEAWEQVRAWIMAKRAGNI